MSCMYVIIRCMHNSLKCRIMSHGYICSQLYQNHNNLIVQPSCTTVYNYFIDLFLINKKLTVQLQQLNYNENIYMDGISMQLVRVNVMGHTYSTLYQYISGLHHHYAKPVLKYVHVQLYIMHIHTYQYGVIVYVSKPLLYVHALVEAICLCLAQ